MIRRLEFELTVETLRIANSVYLSEKCLDILTLDSFKVKANHLVVQVENATSVSYTKSDGGCKPNRQSS